jgi:hypothetical protein
MDTARLMQMSETKLPRGDATHAASGSDLKAGWQRRVNPPLVALICVLLLSKAAVFFLAGMPTPGFAPEHLLRMQTLDRRFLEYFFYNIEKPPLCVLYDFALVKIFGIDGVLHTPAAIYCTSALSFAAALLIYAAARRFDAHPWFAALAAYVFGLGMIPFDYWRPAIHYDQPTIFLAALFVYVMARFATAQSTRNALLLGIVSAIYVLQSSIIALVAPVTIAALMMALWSCGTMPLRRLLPISLAAISLPVLAVVGMAVKNYIAWGVTAPATNGGAAHMMMASRIAGDTGDAPKVLSNAMDAIGAPAWYRWCHENAIALKDPKTGQPYPGWDFMARTHGFCFELNPFGSAAWPTDFEPLLGYLRRSNADPKILASVERQAEIARTRQYLYSGYNPENTLPWVAQYGEFSSRVLLYLIWRHPGVFLKSFKSNLNLMMKDGTKGSAFMLKSQGLLDRKAPRYVLTSLGRVTVIWEWSSRAAFWLAILMSAISTSVAAFNVFQAMFRRRLEPLPGWIALRVQAAFVLAVPGVVILGVLMAVSSGEHVRMFFQATPSLYAGLAFAPMFFLPAVAFCRNAWVTLKRR